jgi:hypothetical protein
LRKVFQKILHEPLVHFLFIGGIIYIFYAVNNPMQNTSTLQQQKQKVVLHKSEIQKIKEQFKSSYHEPVSQDLLWLLKQKLYIEKSLLKESYALGLYKNDSDIDAILLKKMRYIIQKQQNEKELDEKKLYMYYLKHIEDYSVRKNVTFLRLHFANITKKAQKNLYEILRYAPPLKTATKISNASAKSLSHEFGNYFAKKLFLETKGRWLHAIPVKDGYEFVYILSYEISQKYPFEDVEDIVYRDFKVAEDIKNHKKQMKRLEKIYQFYGEK